MTDFLEGDRILVTDGVHLGRYGHVALTHTSRHLIIVRMLGLHAGMVRVVLDRSAAGSWSGILPTASLTHTRPETDAELYARVLDVYSDWGLFMDRAMAHGGAAMDAAANYLGLERGEMPISGAEEITRGFPKR